jgi:hypothetical protein
MPDEHDGPYDQQNHPGAVENDLPGVDAGRGAGKETAEAPTAGAKQGKDSSEAMGWPDARASASAACGYASPWGSALRHDLSCINSEPFDLYLRLSQ